MQRIPAKDYRRQALRFWNWVWNMSHTVTTSRVPIIAIQSIPCTKQSLTTMVWQKFPTNPTTSPIYCTSEIFTGTLLIPLSAERDVQSLHNPAYKWSLQHPAPQWCKSTMCPQLTHAESACTQEKNLISAYGFIPGCISHNLRYSTTQIKNMCLILIKKHS